MSDDLIERLLANGLDECDEAAGRIEALQDENARLRKALSYVVRADNAREHYHNLPNARNRIGDKKSAKQRAKDIWLKAFRAAATNARAALSATKPDAEPLEMTRPGDVE